MFKLMATIMELASNFILSTPEMSGTVKVSWSVVAWRGRWLGHASRSEPPIHALDELVPEMKPSLYGSMLGPCLSPTANTTDCDCWS